MFQHRIETHKYTSAEKFKTMALANKVQFTRFLDAKGVSHILQQG
jgi:hypothetical protein